MLLDQKKTIFFESYPGNFLDVFVKKLHSTCWKDFSGPQEMLDCDCTKTPFRPNFFGTKNNRERCVFWKIFSLFSVIKMSQYCANKKFFLFTACFSST